MSKDKTIIFVKDVRLQESRNTLRKTMRGFLGTFYAFQAVEEQCWRVRNLVRANVELGRMG